MLSETDHLHPFQTAPCISRLFHPHKIRPRPSEGLGMIHVERVKSFNSNGDLLYVKKHGGGELHFLEYGSGPIAGQAINITQQPIFGGLLPVQMNGINDSRQVVGFFGPEINRKGFLGQFDDNGVLDPFVFAHPLSLTDTRLFSISDNGIVVGVRGTKNPFFMIAKN